MIIQNGTIAFKTKSGGGLDPVTGFPIAPVVTFGEPIPCQYRATAYNNLAKANGEHVTATQYEILIEQQDVPSEQIKLTDFYGKEMEYSIIRTELLEAVGQIRIIV